MPIVATDTLLMIVAAVIRPFAVLNLTRLCHCIIYLSLSSPSALASESQNAPITVQYSAARQFIFFRDTDRDSVSCSYV